MSKVFKAIAVFFLWLSMLELAVLIALFLKPQHNSCSGGGEWIIGIILLIFSLWPWYLWLRMKAGLNDDAVESAGLWLMVFLYQFFNAPISLVMGEFFGLAYPLVKGIVIFRIVTALMIIILGLPSLRRAAKGQ